MSRETPTADAFFQSLCNNMGVKLEWIDLKNPVHKNYDEGLRELFYQSSSYQEALKETFCSFHPGTIYRFQDEFLSRYIVFIHPNITPDTLAVIGPYRTDEVDIQDLYNQFSILSLKPASYSLFRKIYHNIPWIADETPLLTMVASYGEILWGGLEHFTIQQLDNKSVSMLKLSGQPNDKSVSLKKYLEDSELICLIENELLEAVANGNVPAAVSTLEKLKSASKRNQARTTLAESKNFAYILNALFRKAAEKSGVSAYYIYELADSFSQQIELLSSVSMLPEFQQKLIAGYCELINQMSVRQYSPLIGRIIAYINMDYTNDLSLTNLAHLFHIDRQYLSSAFHKNTGMTLTEYVQRKRMAHAAILIRKTNLPVNSVAQLCGILDCNYFSKLFKKYYAMSPTLYRKSYFNQSPS